MSSRSSSARSRRPDLAALADGVRRQDHADAQRASDRPSPAAGAQPDAGRRGHRPPPEDPAMTTGTTTAPTRPHRAPQRAARRRPARPSCSSSRRSSSCSLALGYPIGWQVVTSFQQFGLLPAVRPAARVGRASTTTRPSSPTRTCGPSSPARSPSASSSPSSRSPSAALLALLMQRGRHLGPASSCRSRCSLAWAMPVVAVDDGLDLDLRLAPRRAQLAARPASASTSPGPQLARRAAVLLRRRRRHRRLDERARSSPSRIYAGLTQVSHRGARGGRSSTARRGWQRLRHIILPLIAPVLSIVLLLQLIWDLRVFTQIKLLQDAGGVANETNLLGTYIYQLGTGAGRLRHGERGQRSSCSSSPSRSAGTTSARS